MSDHCPKAEDLREAQTRIKALENQLEDLRKYVIANAEARIYASGLADGEKLSKGKIHAAINIAVVFLGTVVLSMILGGIIYVLVGAEHAAAFFSFLLKVLGFK